MVLKQHKWDPSHGPLPCFGTFAIQFRFHFEYYSFAIPFLDETELQDLIESVISRDRWSKS
jgi:hypothetical protein